MFQLKTTLNFMRYSYNPPSISQDGFTLMELLMGLVVLAILVTLAAPSFQTTLQNNRLSGQANELVSAFQYARSEAIRHGAVVELCSSSDSATCGGAWNEGWIARCPNDDCCSGGGLNCNADDDDVLRVWRSADDTFVITPANGPFAFSPEGFRNPDTGNPPSLNVSIPDCTGDNVRQIELQNTGRVASTKVACP